MKVNIHKRNGRFLGALDLPNNATVDEFKLAFYHQFHFYPERQRFTTKDPRGPVLGEGTLKDHGIEDGSVLYFKDLGVQISWRLVFVLEYLGPLLLFPIFYGMPQLVYNRPAEHNLTQKLAFSMVMGHFIKREFETLFIHRFSNATMPIHRLPVNCFHYWILCGLAIGYFLFHPAYTAPIISPLVNFTLLGFFLAFEFLNLQTHVVLRELRPRGSKKRGIPDGWGFQLISCANYFWEILAWLTFAIVAGTLTTWVFVVVAIGQMTQWALKKHSLYQKQFPDYPRRRRAICPYIL